jgi:uncharacterized protein (UPF0335 family)
VAQADEHARLEAEVERLNDENKKLCDYVNEAAGPTSVLVPVASLAAIGERAERAEAERNALQAELAQIKSEARRVERGALVRSWADDVAELAALREAAKPFVRHADDVDRLRHDDDSTCPHRMRAGDLRTLRAVLNGEELTGDEWEALGEAVGATKRAERAEAELAGLRNAAQAVVQAELMYRMDDSLNRSEFWNPALLRAIDALRTALNPGADK